MAQLGYRYLIRIDLPNIVVTLWLRLACCSERPGRFGACRYYVHFIYCALEGDRSHQA